MRTPLFALLALLALGACDSTASLDALRSTAPVGDSYASALSAGYKQLAEEKATAYAWGQSARFADKGLMAAYGRDDEPTAAAEAGIAAAAQPEFDDARRTLIEAVAANRDTQPALAATAVIAYERWLDAAMAGSNVATIQTARDAFAAALAPLQLVQAAEAGSKPPSTAPLDSTSTVLYFPFDSDTLGDTAQTALSEIVGYITKAGNVSVSINGHTDRAGSEPYNQDLSKRRASHVLNALAEAGVPQKIMNFYAFGETDPAVPTADGVREPKNRRVEIFYEKP